MTLNFCDLGGKLVLVTGAGTGIGQGVAMVLAEMGADVALHYSRSAEGAREAVAHIEALGRRAIAIQGDLGVVADCRRVVDEAAAFLGGLDGLVNNAGITTTIDFLDVTEEQFDRSYDLNIRGQFFCAQQAVRHMIERGRALQAAGSRTASGPAAASSTSRRCTRTWGAGALGLRGHQRRDQRVHPRAGRRAAARRTSAPMCWRPAPSRCRATGASRRGTRAKRRAMIVPWGRVGLPEDVGYLAAYLISDGSEFMTGSVLYFDGGLTAKMALPEQSAQSEG